MKIWAHRGCSQLYPENTLLAFEKAMNVKNLTGVELDIQLTRDGEIVVIHDEKVDRTTDGFGYVRDYTLKELKQLHIFAGRGADTERIPTMKEVIELLLPRMKNDGFMINIELKTSVFNYPGIEEKIVALVDEMGVKDNIVYSSFWAESLVNVHAIDHAAKLGVLDNYVSNCLYKAIGLESMWDDVPNGSIALHPAGIYMDLPAEKFKGRDVRAWFGGHLYPELPTGGKLDVNKYAEKGATDLILNEPDKYL
ncbi:glycerophosphoryl diester phosphodiesterase [Butyrivibrio hungatei DSM 14810]|uniref:Glycerophosphoryl diester phosphodiesterase n=1 Tax=Butyrivibrio hungatei DSM 14810 TaxID=1121132 RepID=A0A1M7RYC0_9FIRM|nr:glycerophosphodiester phosphodiesterase family protein [Butyrivibrio hungatei]SHN51134.1 glycerophosphoryl diester phosphodiesterase [Butyrivibrio hungatei DSM 14810]